MSAMVDDGRDNKKKREGREDEKHEGCGCTEKGMISRGSRGWPNRVTRFGIAGWERGKGGERAKKAKCGLGQAGGVSGDQVTGVWNRGVTVIMEGEVA